MKCKHCGAEIDSHSTTCDFCGASISYEMRREQEQVNKQGCPKCGSSNVTFNREKQGDYKGKKGTTVVRSTIGVCKDCGYTWQVAGNTSKSKAPMWLWVLGWICIFPVPLTILLLRKKDMKPALKYGIIAAAWILFLIIGLTNRDKEADTSVTQAGANPQTDITLVESETNIDVVNTSVDDSSIELISGELGEYGVIITLNEGMEYEGVSYEDETFCYFVPAGTYTVLNVGEFPSALYVNQNATTTEYDTDGNAFESWIQENPLGSGNLLGVNETAEITINDGYFIDLKPNQHLILTPVGETTPQAIPAS